MESDEKKATVVMPQSKFDIIMKMARKKGPKYPYSGIINEAIDDFIQKNENPDILVVQMEDVLERRIDLFSPLISDEVRRQVQIELRKLFPERF